MTNNIHDSRFNGLVVVPYAHLRYKGYEIVPKMDMGRLPWKVGPNTIRAGYIVCKDGHNPIQGEYWFLSVVEARAAINLLIYLRGRGRTEEFLETWFNMQAIEYPRHPDKSNPD